MYSSLFLEPLLELDYYEVMSSSPMAPDPNSTLTCANASLLYELSNRTQRCIGGQIVSARYTPFLLQLDFGLYYTQLIFIPIIVVIGIIGNLLSILVFMRTRICRLSSSVYLAALAVSDTGFLLQLGVVWMNYVGVHLFHMYGFCQLFIYLSYVCSFMSVWLVVSFTVER